MDLKLKDNSVLRLYQYDTNNKYIPVPYVQSINNVNITLNNTVNIGGSPIVQITFEPISITDANAVLYGFYNTSNAPAIIRGIFETAGSNTINIRTVSGGNVVEELVGETTIYHRLNLVKVNNVTKSSTSYSASGTYPFKILVGNMNIKIKSVKLTNYSTLQHDLVPAMSIASGHIGEYCLYDKVTNKYFYASSTGSFTGPTSIHSIVTSAYVKNCPYVNTDALLKLCNNLSRVRMDVNNTTTLKELYNYSGLSGFNDNYEEQTSPRLVGTADMTASYYSDEELSYLQSSIDGLVINFDTSKNINNLLETDGLRVQTLDSTKPNYNPAVAIAMHNAGYDVNLDFPIIEGEGTWCRPKSLPTTITTEFRDITTVVDTEGIVSSDTTAEYDFENFEEFQYFDNTSISGGSSTSASGAFGNCTKLKKIILPNTLTSIGAYAFYNCTSLEELNIPNTVTAIGNGAFYNCIGIKDLIIPISIGIYVFRINMTDIGYRVGNNTGTLIIRGNLTGGSAYITGLAFKKIIIYGNLNPGSENGTIKSEGVILVRDNIKLGANSASYKLIETSPFVEVMGEINPNGANSRLFTNGSHILHSGKNGVVSSTGVNCGIGTNYLTKVYVGDGSSRQNDEDVLALYLADTNWSSYSAKLATWYDYNGVYKWYYVTDNLTNCTNTNPDAWPHITRGKSYQTTIVPDEGMTLDSVTVEMYEAVDDGVTPNTPTDITSSVYDSSTGEINIPSVTGNVIITASAS
jgi:hypothetical protein